MNRYDMAMEVFHHNFSANYWTVTYRLGELCFSVYKGKVHILFS